jgi:hypothetical protein
LTILNWQIRDKDKNGGSCIFVSSVINVREVNFLKNLGRDKELEISATKLVDFKFIVICMYVYIYISSVM